MIVDESDSDDEEGGFFSDEDDDDDVEAEASLPGAERPAAPSAERASASIEASVRYEDTQVIDGGFFGCATGPHTIGDYITLHKHSRARDTMPTNLLRIVKYGLRFYGQQCCIAMSLSL